MQGINISSTSPVPLGRVLSLFPKNLNRNYPVTYKGQQFDDTHAAYLHHRDNITTKAEQFEILITLMAHKLKRYPEILSTIKSKGGIPFIESCWVEEPAANNLLDGKGYDSPWIHILVAAIKILAEEEQSPAGQLAQEFNGTVMNYEDFKHDKQLCRIAKAPHVQTETKA